MMRTINIADLFCGAGGTSQGAVEAIRALGYSTRLTAINHWDVAIATHTVNHPEARHLCTSLDDVNPRSLFNEGELDVLWASPECTHHSVARGGKPINDQSRATAWCVVRWAEALRPGVIMVENVPEFETWGGIGTNGRPLKGKKGATFLAWVNALESLGYSVDWRVLCAADYGDPTTRRRLFIQAVRGRRKNIWPDPTHAPLAETDMFGSRKPWVAAREIIDWDLQGKSIFDRKRPLSGNTLRRIMAGLEKFGLKPFVAEWDNQSSPGIRAAEQPLSTVVTKARHGVVQPFLVKLRGTNNGADVDQPAPTVTAGGTHLAIANPFLVRVSGSEDRRPRSVEEPIYTVTAGGISHGLCVPHLLPQHGGGALRPVELPAPTVATSGAIALVEPYLVKYYGTGGSASIGTPIDTVTSKARFGLVRPIVTVEGKSYFLDIRFRMLQPHELAAAQGFQKDYQFTGTKSEQVKQIGNAVPRRMARALCLAAIGQQSNIAGLISKEAA
jgi:DNA (cytosine-5)-methyltransferase 1